MNLLINNVKILRLEIILRLRSYVKLTEPKKGPLPHVLRNPLS
jgi:hypothetical protein